MDMIDVATQSQQTNTSATQGNGEEEKKRSEELIAYIRVSSIGQSLEVQRDKMLLVFIQNISLRKSVLVSIVTVQPSRKP